MSKDVFVLLHWVCIKQSVFSIYLTLQLLNTLTLLKTVFTQILNFEFQPEFPLVNAGTGLKQEERRLQFDWFQYSECLAATQEKRKACWRFKASVPVRANDSRRWQIRSQQRQAPFYCPQIVDSSLGVGGGAGLSVTLLKDLLCTTPQEQLSIVMSQSYITVVLHS